MAHFTELKSSYFTHETEYNAEIYPKFRVQLNVAAVHFKTQYAKLIEKFYDDHFIAIKQNFRYHWRRILTFFLSKNVFKYGVSPQSLYTNLINFIDFSEMIWTSKEENNYFELEEFV